MKLFNIYIGVFLLVVTLTNSYAQVVTKTQQHEFSVSEDVVVDITSKYTNLEFEFTDDDAVIVEAIMQVEGLTESEVEAYYKTWNFKANKFGNKVEITSVLQNNQGIGFKKNGYYQGYFLDADALMSAQPEQTNIKVNSESSSTQKKQGKFDFDAYIDKGDTYLEQWERENNEKIGKRWYNKTKEERIKLRQPKKEVLAELDNKQTIVDKIELKKKSKLPSVNVRDLSKRAIINKTLKIKIPRNAKLNIKAKHGKVVFTETVNNLKAELSYMLLNASKITGEKTSIHGLYSNFEIDNWDQGALDVMFSDYTLIKEVKQMMLTSNASTVSIDNVSQSIDAKGNFKMLSIDASEEVKAVNMNVEDSKKVWLKLPKKAYNLKYEGVNSKLIHPEKFVLKTNNTNPRKQTIESNLLKNNECIVTITSLSSTMQIYDIPWENLKIKSLKE
jgi:hypothetical protein